MTVKVEGKKKQSGKKNPVNSRAKGARGEREFSKFCKEFGYDVHRTAQHCGKTGEAADCIGLPGIHIEVKRVESLRMDDALDQAIRDAAKQGNIPIVAHRRNDRPWVIIMLGSDWFELYRAFELAMEEDSKDAESPEN